MTLPEAFVKDMTPYLPADELEAFCHALTHTEASTCIRLNGGKQPTGEPLFAPQMGCTPIGWNPIEGRYLDLRPSFTLDPLLHAGAYYVQEAASQFVAHVLRSLLDKDEPVTMLDLCAAPGGKSTAALSALPQGSLLVSNEIDRRRARILAENVTKWGMENVIVTGNAPADFAGLTHRFDVILTDVPCSGEGMFRKDEGAVADWSPAKVEGCVELQRSILRDIWPALKPGGLLIYGTCTFNVHEDEEQFRFICDELGAEPVSVPTEPEWNIHASLTDSIDCYRFMPHCTRGEGLFMAALRKHDGPMMTTGKTSGGKNGKNSRKAEKGKREVVKLPTSELSQWVTCKGEVIISSDGMIRLIPEALLPLHNLLTNQGLFMLQSGIGLATMKGKDFIPAHELAMSQRLNREAFATCELECEEALAYLRRESISLPEGVNTGFVVLCHKGLPLGLVKNMGNRCNNLYPQEWRIRYM